eukprot:6178549-Pleurochrysis_carterae.AAC.1
MPNAHAACRRPAGVQHAIVRHSYRRAASSVRHASLNMPCSCELAACVCVPVLVLATAAHAGCVRALMRGDAHVTQRSRCVRAAL